MRSRVQRRGRAGAVPGVGGWNYVSTGELTGSVVDRWGRKGDQRRLPNPTGHRLPRREDPSGGPRDRPREVGSPGPPGRPKFGLTDVSLRVSGKRLSVWHAHTLTCTRGYTYLELGAREVSQCFLQFREGWYHVDELSRTTASLLSRLLFSLT